MAHIEKIQFDELDKKCISEISIVSEVLTSTMNKIGRFFLPYHHNLKELIEKDIKSKRGWSIEKKVERELSPFTFEPSKAKNLQNCFKINNSISIVKKQKENILNRTYIETGYYFEITDENIWNYFYFDINRWDWEIKKYGSICELNFFEQIKNNTTKFSVDIQHPELNDDCETIEISCKEVDEKKIDEMYNIYKIQILVPYLSRLK